MALDALHQLALIHLDDGRESLNIKYKLGEVILVGSDYDRGIFVAGLLDGMLKLPDRMTVYLSPTDKALGFSRRLFARNRLREILDSDDITQSMIDSLSADGNLQLIDVGNAEGSAIGNGYAYFRQSPWVSSDVFLSLRYTGLSPGERGLLKSADSAAWYFPDDYIERARNSVLGYAP